MTPPAGDGEGAPAGDARRLARGHDRGALATVDAAGWPHASLVLYALDASSRPVMMLSDLARHTANLRETGRAALLVDGTAQAGSALTGPRLTIAGTVEPTGDPDARRRFLARHPAGAGFARFGDMRVWRIEPDHGLLVQGFGAIHRLTAADLVAVCPPALAAAEAGIVAHMNDEHADALDLYARVLLGVGGGDWRMTGIDAGGIDLRLGDRVARLDFPAPVADAAGARQMLVDMAKRARSTSRS